MIFAAGSVAAPRGAFADVITNPTHIIDDQWNFPSSSGYKDIRTDITPEADGSPNGYFYASEFYFPGNNSKTPSGGAATGYMGLQDQGNDSNGHTLPYSALIVMYGAVSASASGSATSECGNPSGEGYGCSLHLAYDWTLDHTYRFDVSYAGVSGSNNVWEAQFTDLNIGQVIQLGSIDYPSSYGLLAPAVITFHERFSGLTTSCSNIITSFVKFANVTANNGTIAGAPSSTFSSGVNNSECPGYVYNALINNIVYSGYGPNVAAYSPSKAKVTATPNKSTTTPPPTTSHASTSQSATSSTGKSAPPNKKQQNRQPQPQALATIQPVNAKASTTNWQYLSIGAFFVVIVLGLLARFIYIKKNKPILYVDINGSSQPKNPNHQDIQDINDNFHL